MSLTKRYRREQEMMMSYIHNHGMLRARNSLGPAAQVKADPASWLPQQRKVPLPYQNTTDLH